MFLKLSIAVALAALSVLATFYLVTCIVLVYMMRDLASHRLRLNMFVPLPGDKQ